MNTMFSVENSVLERLDAVSATKVFRSLLWCEARRGGLSSHRVVISLRTDVSDGGIDARVDGKLITDSVLTKGTSYFQIKTGKTFKPWLKSSLLKELFGNAKAKPDRGKLAPGILECLNNHGQYSIVSFGHDLTPRQHSEAKRILRELLFDCGYRGPKAEVLGQGQLIGLVEIYPSLALGISGKGDLSFLTVESWKSRDDMLPVLQLAEPQSKFISEIRETLRGNTRQHVRVIGEPGIGKTRLVLEALSSDDLAPIVAYVPHAEDFQESRLFNELIRKDVTSLIILVIDECVEKQRASIWGALKGKKNIQLITIDHGPERSGDQEMLLCECPRLPDTAIEAIIASYVGEQTRLSHWASWCDGSPRVAHAVGENLRSSPEDLLKPPATVPMWERFVAGYDRLDSKNAQNTLTVMRHIALFTRFGFEDPVSSEAKYISELVQATDPSITWQRFQEIVERLRQHRILQGRRTLFVVPKALHIYLWINYWNSYGRGFDFREFFAKLPSELRRWFLELFIYAHMSPVACDVIRNILGPNGPFSDREFLVSEPGTRFLGYLAEADPDSTLNVLEQNFGVWTPESLKQWATGRQNIVWALEKIAVWREHFSRVAELLVKLALAENASNSNNSTGILGELFMVGTGWAATQASPEERFPVLQKLLESHERQRRELGLLLVKEWLETSGGVRMVGAEFQGLRPEITFWRPRLWNEIFDAWRCVWRYLFSVSRSWSNDERRMANSTLIKAGTSLLNYADVADEIMDTFFELADDTATDSRILTHAIIQKLKIENRRMPKGIRQNLRKLDKKITGQSFWERFCRYVLNTSWDEDYSIVNNGVKQSDLPSKRVDTLVREIKRLPLLFTEHLPRFVTGEGHRLLEFGSKLAQEFCSQNIVDEVVSAQLSFLPDMKTQFIGGYFAGLKKCHVEVWESVVLDLLNALDSRDIGLSIVYSSGMSQQVLQKLLNLFRGRVIKARIFSQLALIADDSGIPQAMVEEVLSCLVASNQEEALGEAIEITDHYFFRKEHQRYCDESLLFQLITANGFFRDHLETMISYHWYCVANAFRKRFPERDLELFSVIMSHPDCLSGIRSHNDAQKIADEIVRTHPDKTWIVLSKVLEADDCDYSVVSWLGDEFKFEKDTAAGAIRFFDSNTIMSWVMNDPKTRAYRLIRCLPKTLDENEGGLLTKLFLEEFGDDDGFAGSLISHFWSGGWTGPESLHASRRRDKAREWISTTKSGKILSWLHRYIQSLNKRIERAELEEERRF